MQGFLDAGFAVVNADFPNTYLEEYVSYDVLKSWNPMKDPAEHGEDIKGIEVCLWGGNDVPQFAYVAHIALPLYGDRAWNCATPIPSGDATTRALTRAILGADTPDAFDLFSYFDGIPLSNACLAEEGILRADADLDALSGTLSRISPKSEDQAFLRDALLELLDRYDTNTLIVGKSF